MPQRSKGSFQASALDQMLAKDWDCEIPSELTETMEISLDQLVALETKSDQAALRNPPAWWAARLRSVLGKVFAAHFDGLIHDAYRRGLGPTIPGQAYTAAAITIIDLGEVLQQHVPPDRLALVDPDNPGKTRGRLARQLRDKIKVLDLNLVTARARAHAKRIRQDHEQRLEALWDAICAKGEPDLQPYKLFAQELVHDLSGVEHERSQVEKAAEEARRRAEEKVASTIAAERRREAAKRALAEAAARQRQLAAEDDFAALAAQEEEARRARERQDAEGGLGGVKRWLRRPG